MSYQTTPSSTRLNYWSKPERQRPGRESADGSSTGTLQCDNAQALNLDAPTAAIFRCSSPGVPKRLDARHLGRYWKRGPIPRRRKRQCTNRRTFGSATRRIYPAPPARASKSDLRTSNWVYAKLHNGWLGHNERQSRVLFRDASVSLTWPTVWTFWHRCR